MLVITEHQSWQDSHCFLNVLSAQRQISGVNKILTDSWLASSVKGKHQASKSLWFLHSHQQAFSTSRTCDKTASIL